MAHESNLTLTKPFKELLEEYAQDYIRFQKRELKVGLHRINKVIGVMGDDILITSLTVEAFLRTFKLGSPAHRNRYRSLLKAVLRWGQARGYVSGEEIRMVGLKMEKEGDGRTRRLAKNEELQLVRLMSPDMKDVFYGALDTGLRFGALTQLTYGEVEGTTIVVPASIQKHKKMQRIPLTKRLMVRIWHTAIEHEVSRDDKLFNVIGWEHQWKAIRKAVGSRDLHWHDLRGEFASRLDEAGVEVSTIQRLLGHHSLLMTAKYLRPRLSRDMEAIERLGV